MLSGGLCTGGFHDAHHVKTVFDVCIRLSFKVNILEVKNIFAFLCIFKKVDCEKTKKKKAIFCCHSEGQLG